MLLLVSIAAGDMGITAKLDKLERQENFAGVGPFFWPWGCCPFVLCHIPNLNFLTAVLGKCFASGWFPDIFTAAVCLGV